MVWDLGVVRLVAGSEGASNPFWLPDSRSLGFFATGKMKRVGVDGGTPQSICDAGFGTWLMATWGANDTILFTGYEKPGVYRVGTNGGTPVAVLEPKGPPSVLVAVVSPDGRHFLFYPLYINQQPEVRVGSRASESKVVLQGYSRAMYADPGYLRFVRVGTVRPVFIGFVVGVGCRLMVLGPGLGTLAGTLKPTPMCAR